MTEDSQPVRWVSVRRMEFIEFRLLWEGRVNRTDIATAFNLSVQQASVVLAAYERAAPTNIFYDRNAKTFVPGPDFRPVFLREHADRQLLQLAAIENGWIEKEDTWFGALPPAGIVPVPPRRVSNEVMRPLLRAIRTGAEIKVEYQSMSRKDPTWRWIAPHALGYDGTRWHARAWCNTHRDFRDFVLSRIQETGETRPANINPAADRCWHETISMILAPNPELSEGAQRAIAKEFRMRRGQLKVSIRVAMVFYFIQHLNLDIPNLPPGRRQLVLGNKNEIDQAVERAQAATEARLNPASGS